MAVVAASVLSGCCSFERDWRSCQDFSYSSDDIAGCWEGNWHSDWNGHEGNLRAIITKQGDDLYHARFKAVFAYIIPYSFDIPLSVSQDGDVALFQSEADLGFLAGGVYRYSGTATSSEFSASYDADSGDHGTFTMQRLPSNSEDCTSMDCVPAQEE